MNWWGRLLRKKQMEKELRAEVEFHLERQVADNVRTGMSEEEARRAATLKFGGMEQVKEDCRDARGTRWVDSSVQDIRFALRTLRKSPGFTATAILTLALGIGANTAIFQLLDAVRLRSLPVANPRTLVAVQIKGGNQGLGINRGDDTFLTYPLWEQIRLHQRALWRVFAWASADFSLGQGSQARRVRGLWVSGGMFPTLGVIPAKGRLINARDDHPDCKRGVVISYAFWQSEFGGQDSAIGGGLVIDDHPVEIIGVTPPGFFGLEVGKSFDVAAQFCSEDDRLARLDLFWLKVMGRLKPGGTLALASAELESLSSGLVEATVPAGYSDSVAETYRKFRLAAYPAGNGVSSLRETYGTPLSLLLGITGLVLLIVCANLANLMLLRASTREREIAVRLALGASRCRLIRQLLSEGLLLAVGGAILGVALAGAFSRGLIHLLSTEGDLLHLDLSIDWRVLSFVSSIAILTCVIFGLAPAFRSSRMGPGEALKAGSRGTTAGRERLSFQRTLVVSQIAVSLVLLVGALLFVRSFWNLMTVDPGFRKDGILVVFLDASKLHLPQERFEPFERDLLAQVRSIPQVESTATATHVPFDGSWTSGVSVEGSEGSSKFTWVSPGYLQTMQIPLITGRDFNDRDTATSPRVAIVSESFARTFLGGRNAVGIMIRTAAEPNFPAVEYEIIGIASDTKYANLRERTPPPECYAPASQYPATGPWTAVFIRTSFSLSAVTAAVREKIGAANREIAMESQVLQKRIQDGLLPERMMALLSGFFGALAVLLAMIGLYGVISYIVVTRRNEIGIRMALGASRGNVVGIIVKQTLVLLALGVTVGVVLALGAARGVASLLFGLQPNDPLTFVGASALLIAVALIASFLPARRAARVDPMIALRYE